MYIYNHVILIISYRETKMKVSLPLTKQQGDELARFLYLRVIEYLHFLLINGDSRRVKSKDFMDSIFCNQRWSTILASVGQLVGNHPKK